LLIRPLLETNRERKHVAHTVVMFIFVACNCGGCLLPIGDPPLFLGYLEGVPFLWTLRLWPEWLFVNGLLVFVYLLLDGLWFHRHETKRDIQLDERIYHRIRIAGWQVNAPLLLGVVLAVALLDPGKPFPGTDWHPWMYLREVAQLCLVGISLILGSRDVRDANLFTYGAIIEVAALFVGIFICMQPALQLLGAKGSELGLTSPAHFFWASGSLSSARQRPDLPGVFQNGPVAADGFTDRARRRRSSADSGGGQPGIGIHGRHDLHRQRAEFHGPLDRRVDGRENAELLRLYGLQLPPLAANSRADRVAILDVNPRCLPHFA
jgi:Putative citrate transport